MLKRTLLGLSAATLLALPLLTAAHAETVHQEAIEHPRIVRAIQEMEGAIAYMESANHDFGGHKGKAIADTRAAVAELREALKYRARRD